MREYGFSLTRILPYKDKIYDSVLVRENTGQWKAVFSHILRSENTSGQLLLKLHSISYVNSSQSITGVLLEKRNLVGQSGKEGLNVVKVWFSVN